jgi:hypothetical protein
MLEKQISYSNSNKNDKFNNYPDPASIRFKFNLDDSTINDSEENFNRENSTVFSNKNEANVLAIPRYKSQLRGTIRKIVQISNDNGELVENESLSKLINSRRHESRNKPRDENLAITEIVNDQENYRTIDTINKKTIEEVLTTNKKSTTAKRPFHGAKKAEPLSSSKEAIPKNENNYDKIYKTKDNNESEAKTKAEKKYSKQNKNQNQRKLQQENAITIEKKLKKLKSESKTKYDDLKFKVFFKFF